MKIFTLLFSVLSLFYYNTAYTQVVDSYGDLSQDAQELVKKLAGTGVAVSNISFCGIPKSVDVTGNISSNKGYFKDGDKVKLGMDKGIILSSGNVMKIVGPNDKYYPDGKQESCFQNTAVNIPELEAIVGNGNIYDGICVEFDFIPEGNKLNFQYVFGSEEYNEYVGREFNDIFGFFVSGENPAGGQYTNKNIAIVPNSSDFVSINNINNDKNSNYFIDNSVNKDGKAPYNLQMDGFTKPLTATIDVLPCKTYRMKIAIADVKDCGWDSWVLMKENSFQSLPVEVSVNYIKPEVSEVSAVESCSNTNIHFKRNTNINKEVLIPIQIQTPYEASVTAVYAVDYTFLPSLEGAYPNFTLRVPANQAEINLSIIANSDNIAEETEKIKLDISLPVYCGAVIDTVIDINIINYDPLTPDIQIGGTSLVCTDGVGKAKLMAAGEFSKDIKWYKNACGGTKIGEGSSIDIAYDNPPHTTTTYYARLENACGISNCVQHTIVANGNSPIKPLTAKVNRTNFCANDNGTITLSTTGGSGEYLAWGQVGCEDFLYIGTVTADADGNTSFTIESPIYKTKYYARWETFCGHSECIEVTVDVINQTPKAASVDRDNFCKDDKGKIKLSTIGMNKELKWYAGGCGTTKIGEGAVVEIESPEVSTIYYVRIENGCGNSPCSTVSVTVIDSNSPIEPTALSVDKPKLCASDMGNIVLSAIGGSGTTLNWYTTTCDGTSIGNGTILTIPSPEITTTYYANYSNICGKSDCKMLEVLVDPVVQIPNSLRVDRPSFCSNDEGNIVISAIGLEDGALTWYSGSCGGKLEGKSATLNIPSPNVSTSYYVKWENSCGSSETCASIAVNVMPNPTLTITTTPSIATTTIYMGDKVEITVNGADNYTWSTDVGNTSTLLINPASQTSTYYITGTFNGSICDDKKSITIEVKEIPLVIYNLFTPNSDNVNDYWYIGNINYYPECKVDIFSRSGQIVYSAKGYNNKDIRWDGKWKGLKALDTTYYYIIQAGKETYTGDVTIVE